MPFDSKKKPSRPPGPPDHRQVVALDAIDRASSDLVRVLMRISNNDPDMKPIIAEINNVVAKARSWVLVAY